MDDGIMDEDVAIVTGAAKGIGRAIATTLATEGASVVVADVDVEGGTGTAREIESEGGTARFLETDVTDRQSVRDAVDGTIDEFGGVDVLVNNAGGSLDDDVVHAVDPESWRTIVELNLTGPYLCTHEVLPAMVESGGGRIAFVSSANAVTGIGLPAYSAAKSGLHALSRLVATQYGQYGIRSNAVCPGTIVTESRAAERSEWSDAVTDQLRDQYPAGEFGCPEDVANAVRFLVSDRSRFVNGIELVVDGGLSAGLDRTFQRTVYDTDRLDST